MDFYMYTLAEVLELGHVIMEDFADHTNLTFIKDVGLRSTDLKTVRWLAEQRSIFSVRFWEPFT